MPTSTIRRSTTRRVSSSRRARGGQALVEAAIVLPMVILFIFGLLEYGRFLMTLHLVNNAAREACRYAVAHTQPVVLGGTTYGNSTTDVTNTFSQYMAGQSLTSQSVTVYLSDTLGNSTGTWTNASAGQSICVRVTGNYSVLMASLLSLPATIPFDVKAVMRTEVN